MFHISLYTKDTCFWQNTCGVDPGLYLLVKMDV